MTITKTMNEIRKEITDRKRYKHLLSEVETSFVIIHLYTYADATKMYESTKKQKTKKKHNLLLLNFS